MSVRFRLIGSGSSGNATLVRSGRRAVLLDAGLSPARLEAGCREEGLDPASLEAILISHEHSDHAGGAAAFSARHRVPVFCSDEVDDAIARSRSPLLRREPLPSRVEFGWVRVITFPVPHDSPNIGFRVETDGVAVGMVTDLGRVTPRVEESLKGCQALYIESNYDEAQLREGPYPRWLKQRISSPTGHLSNTEGAELAAAAAGWETQRVVLVHLSERNNRPQLARDEVVAALSRVGRTGVKVEVAGRHGTARPLEI
jgi:phosphoribosyl 1,2-cyclic phosphodiesterase